MTTPATENETADALLARIAADELGVDALEPRGRDSLDFHEVHIVGLAKALRRAYEAGRSALGRPAAS